MSPDAHGEVYIAGFAGPASPQGFKFVHGSGATSDLTFSNLALSDSGVGGIKVGYYLPREWVWNILGVEGKPYYHSPTIKAQTVGVQQAGVGPIPFRTITKSSLKIATTAFNVVLRYPGRILQPYIGGGWAISWATLSGGI